MIVTRNNGNIRFNIYSASNTTYEYSVIKNHLNNSEEFITGMDDFLATLDIEKIKARIAKFSSITGASFAFAYLGKMNLLNHQGQSNIICTKNEIRFVGVDSIKPVQSCKTLLGGQITSNSGVGYKDSHFYCKVEGDDILKYDPKEDVLEILDDTKIEEMTIINTFLTRFCNQTLRAAVVVDNKLEIMEINC